LTKENNNNPGPYLLRQFRTATATINMMLDSGRVRYVVLDKKCKTIHESNHYDECLGFCKKNLCKQGEP